MSANTAAVPAFYTVAEACQVLGLKRVAFFTSYAAKFTDCRPVEKRKHGVPLRIRRSEVELVIERGWEALAQRRAATAAAGGKSK